jgi:hypothetical protein
VGMVERFTIAARAVVTAAVADLERRVVAA